ncbi:hypothetical protein Tco_1015434 [Tanacetum coccineum]|uniref:Uncharacterized protein n=1 Tax=Tanacetum coccineum TaxID=301880 RepID=A0ABQ5FLG1_9ASTR
MDSSNPRTQDKVQDGRVKFRMYKDDIQRVMDKMLLAKKEEEGGTLNEEEQNFMEERLELFDLDCEEELNTTSLFMADRVDAFDLDCDEEVTASAIFMAKISPAGSPTDKDHDPSYDPNALSKVPTYDNYDMLNSFGHETQHLEQPVLVIDTYVAETNDNKLFWILHIRTLTKTKLLSCLYDVSVPQNEFSEEQKYFLQIPENFIVKKLKDVPKELPKTSKAKKVFTGMKCHVQTLEEVVKDKTTIIFSDGTIELIKDELETMIKATKVGRSYRYLNDREYTDTYIRRSVIIINEIMRILKACAQMRRLESFVGGRPKTGDI